MKSIMFMAITLITLMTSLSRAEQIQPRQSNLWFCPTGWPSMGTNNSPTPMIIAYTKDCIQFHDPLNNKTQLAEYNDYLQLLDFANTLGNHIDTLQKEWDEFPNSNAKPAVAQLVSEDLIKNDEFIAKLSAIYEKRIQTLEERIKKLEEKPKPRGN